MANVVLATKDNWPGVVAAIPVPLTLKVCDLPTPLLVSVILPERVPIADGLNAILNEHDPPGLTMPHAELMMGNSEATLLTMLCTVTSEAPTLLIVMVFAVLVVPTV